MSFPRAHNVASYIDPVRASDNVAATAAGTGDNTVVTGNIIDRTSWKFPLSLALYIGWMTVLTAAKTLTLKNVVVEHGDDSGLSDAATWATLEDGTGTVLATGAGTVRGQKKYAVDLNGAKRYIRVKYTPDLSNTATDTAELAAAVVFGGQDSLS